MELDQTSLWLDQSICKVINGDFLIKDPYNDRINKHPIFSFINQVMKDKAHTQLSSCGLSIEAIVFNKQITVRDVLATFTYANTLKVYEVSGRVLKQYLEQSLTFFILDDGEIKINPKKIEPKNELYNYEMIDG